MASSAAEAPLICKARGMGKICQDNLLLTQRKEVAKAPHLSYDCGLLAVLHLRTVKIS